MNPNAQAWVADYASVLRIYDIDECDTNGVPLDWQVCRACRGRGLQNNDPNDSGPGTSRRPCTACEGHGSLRLAAMAAVLAAWGEHPSSSRARCEDCKHPMGEGKWVRGSWESDLVIPRPGSFGWAIEHLRRGHEPPNEERACTFDVHYSPCDEGCRHGGPGRCAASWRQVDVRTLGWPHDLRPGKLAVLCLRCWAKNWVKEAA